MISFIIPSHNYGHLLERCLKSINKNNQKYIKEILIVNDASNDNTEYVIKKLKREIPFYYFKKNFKNLSKTMNFAINRCKGKIICKIDPDDEIKKNFAEILGKKFLDSDVDFMYSNVIINDTKRKIKYIKKQKINKFLNLFQYPHGGGCLISKELWRKVGGFNELNFFQDDYDFWLRINKLKRVNIKYFDKSLYIYNRHENNMSKNFFKKNLTKIKILLLNL